MKLLGVKVTVGTSIGIPFGFTLATGFPHGYDILFGLASLVCLYGFVLAHELGHIYAVQKLGYTCNGVHLFMFGGVAKIGSDVVEGTRKHPMHETLIAAAGPAVSLIYAAVFGIMYYYWPNAGTLFAFAIHVLLLIFNCLPIFPLDGGRVFRSLLASCFGYAKGTKIAGDVAVAGCLGVFVSGVLIGGWGLCIVSGIILFMSRHEVNACLEHEHNAKAFAVSKPIPFHGERVQSSLEKRYIVLRDQGVEPHEALRRAFEREFPDVIYDVILSRAIEEQHEEKR